MPWASRVNYVPDRPAATAPLIERATALAAAVGMEMSNVQAVVVAAEIAMYGRSAE